MSEQDLFRKIEDLENLVAGLKRRLDETEEWRSKHQGNDWGRAGINPNSPHPNQSVDTIESGGGVIRQDSYGMQLESNSATDVIAIYVVPILLANPEDNETYGALSGTVYLPTNQCQMTLYATTNWTSGYQGRYSVSSDDDNATLLISAGTVTSGNLSPSAILTVRADDASGGWIEVHPGLVFNAQAADPVDSGPLQNGGMWYHSTAHKFRGRVNGATDNFAMDANVTTAISTHAGEADPHTGYVKESDANYIDLTDGGATVLHSHAGGSGHTIRENDTDQTSRTGLNFIDAAAGAGLITDDAGGNETEVNLTLYVLASGARALTADWDAGSFEIRAQTFESDVATGTAPLVIASTTLVPNLNADLLDSQTGSYYLDAANFTGANWTDLTDSGATTLHSHTGGSGISIGLSYTISTGQLLA